MECAGYAMRRNPYQGIKTMNCAPTNTTKASAASNSATIQIPYAARRLAYQLERTPQSIMMRALSIGLRTIDANLAADCSPFVFGLHEPDGIDVYQAMNRLSPERFAALCECEHEPQRVLSSEFYRAKGFSWIGDGEEEALKEALEDSALVLSKMKGGQA